MESWADSAIETAVRQAEAWFRALPEFKRRVNLGSVVGRRRPAILSEHDCVMNFARFLNEAGVAWDAIHHQVSCSRWLFDGSHPAARAGLVGKKRWCADLGLVKTEDFLKAELPAKLAGGFQFDAFLEFAYLSDFFTLPSVHPYGHPAKYRQKVSDDVAKIASYLATSVCRSGYVVVFAECDCEFPSGFQADAEKKRCQVRFVRGY